jgi:hypothetical protein
LIAKQEEEADGLLDCTISRRGHCVHVLRLASFAYSVGISIYRRRSWKKKIITMKIKLLQKKMPAFQSLLVFACIFILVTAVGIPVFATKAELTNTSITENGFYLDNSKIKGKLC